MRDNITGQIFNGTGPICCAPVAAPTAHLLRVKFENSEGPRQLSAFCNKASFYVVQLTESQLVAVLKTKIMSRRPTKVLCRCTNVAKAIRINVTIRISLPRVGFNLATIFSFPLPLK
jgi:hypothetical protein